MHLQDVAVRGGNAVLLKRVSRLQPAAGRQRGGAPRACSECSPAAAEPTHSAARTTQHTCTRRLRACSELPEFPPGRAFGETRRRKLLQKRGRCKGRRQGRAAWWGRVGQGGGGTAGGCSHAQNEVGGRPHVQIFHRLLPVWHQPKGRGGVSHRAAAAAAVWRLAAHPLLLPLRCQPACLRLGRGLNA